MIVFRYLSREVLVTLSAVSAVLLVISLLAMLSFNLLAGWTPLGKNFFDWLDYLTSRWMMPLGGILMVILAGYCLRREIMRDELGLPPAYSGVRPKLSGPGEPAADFVIQSQHEHGLSGLINLFGIESPGLTASLAIAERIARLL